MKIRITAFDPARRRVRFACVVGDAEATWASAPPVVGRDYHVELAVERCLVWGVDLARRAPGPDRLIGDDHGLALDGSLEAMDDDGVATLRLGPALLLVETEGEPAAVGSPVRARVDDVRLYDARI